jgi:Leucine-rich repeat (LRR) protein
VTSLQISVDPTKQSVETIGELLPTLQQLRLQQSSLNSFRDLGTSLVSLRVLWAMHCQISDLDGIGALVNLQELYLQHNNVSDISPLTMHEEIRVVGKESHRRCDSRRSTDSSLLFVAGFADLEGNQVADVGQLEQLGRKPLATAFSYRPF